MRVTGNYDAGYDAIAHCDFGAGFQTKILLNLVKAISKGWFDWRVIYDECGYADVFILIDDAFADGVEIYRCACGGKFFGQVATDVNIGRVEFHDAVDEILRACWAIEFKRSGTAELPGGVENVGQAVNVIGMQMR